MKKANSDQLKDRHNLSVEPPSPFNTKDIAGSFDRIDSKMIEKRASYFGNHFKKVNEQLGVSNDNS